MDPSALLGIQKVSCSAAAGMKRSYSGVSNPQNSNPVKTLKFNHSQQLRLIDSMPPKVFNYMQKKIKEATQEKTIITNTQPPALPTSFKPKAVKPTIIRKKQLSIHPIVKDVLRSPSSTLQVPSNVVQVSRETFLPQNTQRNNPALSEKQCMNKQTGNTPSSVLGLQRTISKSQQSGSKKEVQSTYVVPISTSSAKVNNQAVSALPATSSKLIRLTSVPNNFSSSSQGIVLHPMSSASSLQNLTKAIQVKESPQPSKPQTAHVSNGEKKQLIDSSSNKENNTPEQSSTVENGHSSQTVIITTKQQSTEMASHEMDGTVADLQNEDIHDQTDGNFSENESLHSNVSSDMFEEDPTQAVNEDDDELTAVGDGIQFHDVLATDPMFVNELPLDNTDVDLLGLDPLMNETQNNNANLMQPPDPQINAPRMINNPQMDVEEVNNRGVQNGAPENQDLHAIADHHENCCVGCREFLVSSQMRIMNKLNLISASIEGMNPRNVPVPVVVENYDLLPPLPLNSINDMQEFNNALMVDQDMQQQYINKISRIGFNDSLEKRTKRMMSCIITDDLAKNLTWVANIKNKTRIHDMFFIELLIAQLNVDFPENDTKIRKTLQTWIQKPSDRIANREKKLRRQQHLQQIP